MNPFILREYLPTAKLPVGPASRGMSRTASNKACVPLLREQ
jgi:hypothetical protein